MVAKLTHSGFVWSLLLCLVLVNGAMAAPSVGHAQHHPSHQAGTHSTGICAWLCAAGEGVESSAVFLHSALLLVAGVVVLPVDTILDPGAFSVFLRGPPALFS